MKIRWIHLVARTHRGLRPFEDRDQALELWNRLRVRFPTRVLAAVLMVNHLHLVLETARPAAMRFALACQLRAFTRNVRPGSSLWEPLPPFDEVHDLKKLKTVIRYVHLNPCRARMVRDPWDWEFSTLRDHGELSLNPWIDRERLASATRMGLSDWKREQEIWIQRDEFVDPELAERRMSPPDLKTLSPEEVRRVVAWATASAPERLQQRGDAKDWHARLWIHLHPNVSLVGAERELGIRRERLSDLRQLSLSPRELRIFESIAFSVRAQRMGLSQRG